MPPNVEGLDVLRLFCRSAPLRLGSLCFFFGASCPSFPPPQPPLWLWSCGIWPAMTVSPGQFPWPSILVPTEVERSFRKLDFCLSSPSLTLTPGASHQFFRLGPDSLPGCVKMTLGGGAYHHEQRCWVLVAWSTPTSIFVAEQWLSINASPNHWDLSYLCGKYREVC